MLDVFRVSLSSFLSCFLSCCLFFISHVFINMIKFFSLLFLSFLSDGYCRNVAYLMQDTFCLIAVREHLFYHLILICCCKIITCTCIGAIIHTSCFKQYLIIFQHCFPTIRLTTTTT